MHATQNARILTAGAAAAFWIIFNLCVVKAKFCPRSPAGWAIRQVPLTAVALVESLQHVLNAILFVHSVRHLWKLLGGFLGKHLPPMPKTRFNFFLPESFLGNRPSAQDQVRNSWKKSKKKIMPHTRTQDYFFGFLGFHTTLGHTIPTQQQAAWPGAPTPSSHPPQAPASQQPTA